jgi:enamine deaminase RidA (YjgF/YER057c/UK114 family)
MLMQTGGDSLLFVSGTASIVGHETLHIGNASAQVQETIANIFAVMAQAQRAGLDSSITHANLLLKTYLRRPEDLTMVRNSLSQAFGPAVNTLYLQADICRSNLLLEIEAAYVSAAAPIH